MRSFYLFSVTVTRGLERDGDSAQFIITMEKPSHLCSWSWDQSSLHLEGQHTPHCLQGPLVSHLPTERRLERGGAWLADTGFAVRHEPQRPGILCPLRARLRVDDPYASLVVVSQHAHGYLKWTPASDMPFPWGAGPPPLEELRTPLPASLAALAEYVLWAPPIRHTIFKN